MRAFDVTPYKNRFPVLQTKGEAIDFRLNFAFLAQSSSSSLSSVAWSVESGSASVDASTEAGNTTTTKVTFSTQGKLVIKVAATMANSEITNAYIEALVTDEQGCDY